MSLQQTHEFYSEKICNEMNEKESTKKKKNMAKKRYKEKLIAKELSSVVLFPLFPSLHPSGFKFTEKKGQFLLV